ncbi:hypothetical protein DYD21_07150 [Rhodohalobacter sp. SW132]|uniref:hypothetical protein n=1 Tax=Rhodohalobacter sp. SW132 TaxID=2293433 RepID=UPI000E364079|nr:hypothetical protein [Rhodohalobacter sp. SW132]REL37560.1 hypothetical protein DYD21_07150 [Rhodohalobacter sp. SW132]
MSTISSAGHWFFATRKTVEEYVPGILKKHSFESLIHKSILWIDSTDSLAMLLYFALAFVINPWIAAAVTFGFHFWWYFNKSAFVSLSMLPVLRVIHHEFVQLLAAGLLLSLMGINGMYLALFFGVIFFFLFKIGLLRRFWDRFDKKKAKDKLPLNDRVLKMLLVRYSMKENIAPQEVQRLEKHVQDAVIKFNTKKKK